MSQILYIRPGAILTDGRALRDYAVIIEDERIAEVGRADELPPPPSARELPASDLLLAPGFIDLQINGAFGHDFTEDPSSIWEVAAQLPRYGVTAFLPTVITSPLETIAAAQAVVCGDPPEYFAGAMPVGLHLEGPFLNPRKRGAHNPKYLRLPDLEAITRWTPEEGVRMVTIAPELPGALDVIEALTAQGVVVSAGHSMATMQDARAGFDAGITYGTHLFNAMPAMDHREPGLVGALLSEPDAVVGLIVDGVHVHPDMVALVSRSTDCGRISLVTDAMAGLGMPPGTYRLSDHDVTVDGKSARLADGTLAGSVLSLDKALRNMMRYTGCSPAEAVAAVTEVPAALLGVECSMGRIAPGLCADMVLLTRDLEVIMTIAAGQIVHA
jgi:N-acetylglucosamine-6-phosphate deacetylase